MKVFPHVLQGSEAWMAMRKGRPTASNFDKIITAAKGDLSKQRFDYMATLISECFCPEFVTWTGNFATDRGNELEPEARQAFTDHTGLNVVQVGFCTQDNGVVGCSPDALILNPSHQDAEEDCQCDDQILGEYCGYCDWEPYIAGVEIKCPFPATHVKYVADGVLPDDYKQQVHGSMAVTGLNEWHFWSYFPGMRPFHLKIERDAYTTKVESALEQFMIEYGELSARVKPQLIINTP